MVFRGHNESCEARNKGNFFELLQFLSHNSDEIRSVVLENAPENHKLTSPDIQKDIVLVHWKSMMLLLRNLEIQVLLFWLTTIHHKEQMAIVLRYIDLTSWVIERFFGLIHDTDTNDVTLKSKIEATLANHDLSLSTLLG